MASGQKVQVMTKTEKTTVQMHRKQQIDAQSMQETKEKQKKKEKKKYQQMKEEKKKEKKEETEYISEKGDVDCPRGYRMSFGARE
uniref:Uncharacterized protein n=1 Tax=Toxoplasma gondii TgCATBr9 TaxID=943120 RepID=A0A2T6IRM3_TOXGO|nr:hypothetical protein TGBR9_382660 [Toxoplasma gondii TgCATBr9]